MRVATVVSCALIGLAGCQENTGRAADTEPKSIWQPVSSNRAKQELSLSTTKFTLALATETVTLPKASLVRSFASVESSCPEKALTAPLMPDDATTSSDLKYVLFENVTALPPGAYGAKEVVPPPESVVDSKYLLKIEETHDPEIVRAKVLAKVDSNNFSQRWVDGYDEESGDPVSGIETEVLISLPAGPTIGYVKSVSKSVDPCW